MAADVELTEAHRLARGRKAAGVSALGEHDRRRERPDPEVRSERSASSLLAGNAAQLPLEGPSSRSMWSAITSATSMQFLATGGRSTGSRMAGPQRCAAARGPRPLRSETASRGCAGASECARRRGLKQPREYAQPRNVLWRDPRLRKSPLLEQHPAANGHRRGCHRRDPKEKRSLAATHVSPWAAATFAGQGPCV
jgi:hypothetical protein